MYDAITSANSITTVLYFSLLFHYVIICHCCLKIYKYMQASVYSLLQAASEISSRGDGRDRDINVFVQRR